MRMVGALVAVTILGGCITRDPAVSVSNATPSGNWKIEKTVDRITGAPLPSAQLMTRTSSNSAVTEVRLAGLQLTCFEKQPLVRLSFEFKVGSEANTSLGYRFDEKPGRDDVKSRILPGYQVVVIEGRAAVSDFIRDLNGSRVLYVRIRSLNAGRTTAEFNLDGSAAAVQAAFAGCPLTPAPAEAGRKRQTSDAVNHPGQQPV
ncbi:MAG: hypothetical protein J0H71_13875 [Rhizobiales bacterium]|nr:hypothetical protein [Hyphomicrobiales bacterium]